MDLVDFREHPLYEERDWPIILPYNLNNGPWQPLPPRPPRQEGDVITLRHPNDLVLNQLPNLLPHSCLTYTSYEFSLILALLAYIRMTPEGDPYLQIMGDNTLRHTDPRDARLLNSPNRLSFREVSEIAYFQTFGIPGRLLNVRKIFDPSYKIFDPFVNDGARRRLSAICAEVQMRPTFWMDEVRDAWFGWVESGGRLEGNVETPRELFVKLPRGDIIPGEELPNCHANFEEYRRDGEPLYESRITGSNATYTLRGPLVESNREGGSRRS